MKLNPKQKGGDNMSNGEESQASVTRDMIEKYRELSAIISDFRKTLGPRKDAIFSAVTENVDMAEVIDLIEVSGGESLTVSGEFEGEPLSVMFRLKRKD